MKSRSVTGLRRILQNQGNSHSQHAPRCNNNKRESAAAAGRSYSSHPWMVSHLFSPVTEHDRKFWKHGQKPGSGADRQETGQNGAEKGHRE